MHYTFLFLFKEGATHKWIDDSSANVSIPVATVTNPPQFPPSQENPPTPPTQACVTCNFIIREKELPKGESRDFGRGRSSRCQCAAPRLNEHCFSTSVFTSNSSTDSPDISSSTDVWVLFYEHLKARPRSDQALTLLQWVASRVKPIVRKHGWRLPVPVESFPDITGLIGTPSTFLTRL